MARCRGKVCSLITRKGRRMMVNGSKIGLVGKERRFGMMEITVLATGRMAKCMERASVTLRRGNC